MSRIGKMPIAIPRGVEVTLAGNEVTVKGPLGELSKVLPAEMALNIKDNQVEVVLPKEKRLKPLHGLTRTLVANMVEGVTKGFQKTWKSWV